VLDFAASVTAGSAPIPSQPRIRAALVRPKDQKGYWMTFTGPGYNAPARMTEFTRIMTEAARQLEVQLEIQAEPDVTRLRPTSSSQGAKSHRQTESC
jgi:hypothetical protein